MITYACERSCSPCQSSVDLRKHKKIQQSLVDYGNRKRPSMHLLGLGSAALAAAVAVREPKFRERDNKVYKTQM